LWGRIRRGTTIRLDVRGKRPPANPTHPRHHPSATPPSAMAELVCIVMLPVMMIVSYLIQRLVPHHSQLETELMNKDLVIEAMNKHDRDFDD